MFNMIFYRAEPLLFHKEMRFYLSLHPCNRNLITLWLPKIGIRLIMGVLPQIIPVPGQVSKSIWRAYPKSFGPCIVFKAPQGPIFQTPWTGADGKQFFKKGKTPW
jgi:hypothetical protein